MSLLGKRPYRSPAELGPLVEGLANVLERAVCGVPGIALVELALMEKLTAVGMDGPVTEIGEAGPEYLLIALKGRAMALQRLAEGAGLGVDSGDALATALQTEGAAQPLHTARAPLNRPGMEDVEERGTPMMAPDLFHDTGNGADQVLVLIEDLFRGPAFVASRERVPIVPMGIGGSDRAMPIGKKMIRPAKVVLVVGEPIYPDVPLTGRVPRAAVDELTERLRVELQRLYDDAKQRA